MTAHCSQDRHPGSESEHGETLVEGIIAVGIVGLVIVGLAGLVGTTISMGSVRDAQARTQTVTRSVFEAVSAYPVPTDATLTCADSRVLADLANLALAVPRPDGITLATPTIYPRYVDATSTTPTIQTSDTPCPDASTPASAVPVGFAVTITATADGSAGGTRTSTDSMTALVGRRAA